MSRPVTGGGFIIPSGKGRGTGLKGFQQRLRASGPEGVRKAAEITALKKQLRDTVKQAGGAEFMGRDRPKTEKQIIAMQRFAAAGRAMSDSYRSFCMAHYRAPKPPKAQREDAWNRFKAQYPIGSSRPADYRTLGSAGAQGPKIKATPYTSLPAYAGDVTWNPPADAHMGTTGTAFLGWNTPEWLNRAGQAVAPALNIIPGQVGQAVRAAASGELGSVGQAAQYAASRFL